MGGRSLNSSKGQKSASNKQLVSFYQTMLKIRKFELKVAELFGEQEMRSPTHLYTGHEAVATGIIAALRQSDPVVGYYRSHGYYLAKGGDPNAMIAEFYVKATGANRGKCGSLLLSSPEVGYMGSTAIVSGGISIATGFALAAKLQKKDTVAVCFFGDGATEEGVFYESLNFAGLKKLPVIFVCENNFYAVQSRISARQAISDNIYDRGSIFNVPGAQIDGNNVEEVFSAAQKAVARARSGEGPTIIEAKTYRWHEHVGPGFDTDFGWRPKEEWERWKAKDPVKNLEKTLILNKVLNEKDIIRIESEIDKIVLKAFEFAKKSPLPAPSELFKDVY